MSVRTRFAPSPTGYMHIGGMRTALFNWLWARHNGGQFILRIDDTDRQRNIDEALAPILAAFCWLGLDWDEGPEVGGDYGPYFQSQRGNLYEKALTRLLEEGKAYRDFDPPELTQQDREAAEKEKRTFLNIRRSLELSAEEVEHRVADGTPHVIRFLVDRERTVSIDDQIRGHVEWDCGLIADPVICRGDGSPLYNFASVVDDALMQISHVIRAEEHLTNTAVQALLFEALGHPLPAFAHIPFVAAPGTKEKLSKRDKKLAKYRSSPQFKKLFDVADEILPQIGAGSSESLNPVMVAYYEAVGFLPQAVLNGLSRLGWSLDDKTENMSLPFVVEHFTLDRVVKAPAGLDPDKLLAYQEHWMSQLSTEEKVERCLPYLVKAGRIDDPVDDETRAFVTRLIEALGDRLKLFSDVLRYDEYFVEDSALVYDEKAFQKRILKPKHAVLLLKSYINRLKKLSHFDATELRESVYETLEVDAPDAFRVSRSFWLNQIDIVSSDTAHLQDSSLAFSLEAETREFVASQGIKMGDVIHAIRVAVTGKPTGPSLFEGMELLGREACVRRLERAVNRAEIHEPTKAADTPSSLDTMMSLPTAITLPDAPKDVGSPIELYSGNLCLSTNKGKTTGAGSVEMEFAPTPKIRFVIHSNESRAIHPGKGQLSIDELDLSFDALVTTCSHSAQGDAVVKGIPQKPVQFGNGTSLVSVHAYITNFHSLLGDGIRSSPVMTETGSTLKTWAGRTCLNTDEWSIILDASPDHRDITKEAAATRGFGVTHVIEVKRGNGQAFTSQELEDGVLIPLQYFLTFSRGFGVAPLLPRGCDVSGTTCWRDWSVRHVDSYMSVGSWFPIQNKTALQLAYRSFVSKWCDVELQEVLRLVIYWYTRGNVISEGVEPSVIASCVALEGLIHGFGFDADGNQQFAERLESLLGDARLPSTIPNEMSQLIDFAKDVVGVASGPTVLAHLRSRYIHPFQDRSSSVVDNAFLLAEWQAANLALWYVELLLLRLIDYDGKYFRRFGEERYAGQEWDVPWAKK